MHVYILELPSLKHKLLEGPCYMYIKILPNLLPNTHNIGWEPRLGFFKYTWGPHDS